MLCPCPVWVSSVYCSFLPQSKDRQVRVIGDSKLPIGMSVGVNGLCVPCNR
uniref:Uncharacterized protein n=1 Tax=Anguilla anguilla TaxID=7936 RepID=A0A0E9TVQ9_ANGAN